MDNHLENSLAVSFNVKHRHTTWPFLEKGKNTELQKCTKVFTEDLFLIGKN